MYMRVTRGRHDPSKFDEISKLRPDLVAAVERQPGFQSYLTGADRASGRTVAVSTWTLRNTRSGPPMPSATYRLGFRRSACR